jgi:hypothetical protein
MKKCKKCQKLKSTDEYYSNQGYFRPRCKVCVREDQRTAYRLNSSDKLAREKTRREKSRVLISEQTKKRHKKNPDARKNQELRTRFGINYVEYQQMHEKQKGLCAICDKPESQILNGTVKRLSVDHCHSTGKIRGLLCTKCNVALGLLKDDINVINNCVSYLQKDK